ncbi:hypothetical protein DMC47_17690 [Nostoc sp. 3335mG]|nr:hypothetical protein DMC47_17690 [Nostoc sp. 3335mG]
MRPSIRRGAALRVCRLLERVLPPQQRDWVRAIAFEIDAIPDDGEALHFALHSFCGLVPGAAAFRLRRPPFGPVEPGASGSSSDMTVRFPPLGLGIACAIGAVLLGLAYMSLAGAPVRYLGINAGALVIGLLLAALIRDGATRLSLPSGVVVTGLSFLLLMTTLTAHGGTEAARWIRLAGISIQPSLILVPGMIVAFARSRSWTGASGMIVAAATLALQPDRAMAGVLAAGLMVLAAARPDRRTLLALAASLAGMVAALAQPDRFPPAPYVDQVLYTAFDVHPLAGAAVLAGALLMMLPAAAAMLPWHRPSEAHLAFGAAWFAAILAAALGNYPTPLVGYGGSAVIGYLLSVALLPASRPHGDRRPFAPDTTPARRAPDGDGHSGFAAAA